MFEFKACAVLKTKELTSVSDCFQNKHNEEIGHYRQALIKIDLASFPNRLLKANANERNVFEISPSDFGIHWPLIDEDISLSSWLNPVE